ncbi:RNA-binding protein [Pseudobacteroides cellulosolvens]|uniref:RNA-binding S4 domain protein n=1 Tax=Pseudobacteroides cellulosolvens ATCC 35603 = DSM 2933 TaxID=398512 RepID=A0A0L6JLM2_9FIRM|nr:YlmH/Sll1252 family protein [Pseudobacteroides cellulosolvens]KNY26668.1 RNA-binding S4 domain protein [Pseudobacteroides cellulosolvens ATCC 35603 = DSM 2933]
MINREAILKRITGIDDKIFVSKIIDKALKAQNSHCIISTDFLDPYQSNIIKKSIASSLEVNCVFYGGYAAAEREIAIFCPQGMSLSDFHSFKYPLKIIEVKTKSRITLTHRDFLGSLMGLGIKREKIGDILLEDDICRIIVIGEIAEYLEYNLLKVGNANVEVTLTDVGEIQHQGPSFREIKASVASLRLDCIASSGFGISRSKIGEFIKGDKVSLNWEKTTSLTKQVSEGDTISIRGKGRLIVDKVGAITKKGRISITLLKYL